MELQGSGDIVRFQRASDLGGLEFLYATFVRHSFPRHTHDTFAIGVIESGVQATYYNGSTHIATSRDICLINPGEVHTGFSPHPSGWTYRVFYPEPSLLQGVASEMLAGGCGLPHFSSPVIKDRPLSTGILSLLKALDLSDVTIERETFLYSVIAQMISRHADRKGVFPPPKRTEKRVVRVLLDYLDHHFTENISLRILSDVADLSAFHLLRVFRAAVGLPPHAYVIQKRVDHARRLLLKGLPIADVSLEAGFADQSHFTRAFKRIVGITPGCYRSSNSVQDSSRI
jgi:AraC-like DNA-binding protein